MMAVADVGLENVGSYVSDTAEKLSGAPEVSLTKMSAQPRMLAEKFVGAAAFEQLKGFGNAHCRGQADKDMDVISLNLKLEDFHTLGFGNLTQKLFAVLANNLKLKRVLRIFWLPHKVERILSNTMAVAVKSFHHFFVPPRVFCGAHATQASISECASCAAHSFIVTRLEKHGGISKVAAQLVAIPLRPEGRSILANM